VGGEGGSEGGEGGMGGVREGTVNGDWVAKEGMHRCHPK
jgi:hypothetical protein